MSPRSVAFVVFEGTKLLDVAGPLQVLSDARLPEGTPAYHVKLLSERGGQVATDTVCQISSVAFAKVATDIWDTVLISGGRAAYDAMHSKALQDFVGSAAFSSRRLASICLGAFILAEGGHLTNRKATTHWDGCTKLRADFPDITVLDNAIFVEDRGVWTSAGVTAGIDMALEMVKQDLGASEAMRLAKSFVLPMHRSGGQRQFSASLDAQISRAGTRFANLVMYVNANLRQAHTVSSMASHVGMSERNFSRLFAAELGISPARFVEQLRVDRAAIVLHQSSVTLASAQDEAGFTSAEQMRRAFHRCKGVSPSEYAVKFST